MPSAKTDRAQSVRLFGPGERQHMDRVNRQLQQRIGSSSSAVRAGTWISIGVTAYITGNANAQQLIAETTLNRSLPK